MTPIRESARAGQPFEQGQTASRWLGLVWAAIIIIGDRISKSWIRADISPYESVSVVPGWFRIVHTENPGAAFGVLADGDPRVRSVLLIGVAVVVLCVVAAALWSRRGVLASPITRFGLALIFGGATGNLFDRITRGTVTDFLEIYRGGWSFPAFNVADSAITVGSVLLVIDLLWSPQKTALPPATLPPPETKD